MTKNYEAISPTAKFVAYWRQFADIPFSKDVALLFDAKGACQKFVEGLDIDLDAPSILTPMLELRYKTLEDFVHRHSYKQVLEFASGISLRGLAMTADPSLVYVETDLPGLTVEKNQLVNAIAAKHKLAPRKKLFSRTVNILNFDEIREALIHFDPKKPIVIIHEGLFQYLTMEEKSAAAKNIRAVLEQFGGAWISPDFDTVHNVHAYTLAFRYKGLMSNLMQATGCDLEKNIFASDQQIESFFHECGFACRNEPQLKDQMAIASLGRNGDKQEQELMLRSLRLWVATIQKR